MIKRTIWIVVLVILVLSGVCPARAQTGPAQASLLARLGRGSVTSVAWSPDGITLAAAGSAGVWLYDTADFTAEPRLLRGQTGELNAVAFSPDGSKLASATSAGWDPSVWLWDVATGDKLAALQDPDSAVMALAWSPDGKTLATGEAMPGNKVRLWDVATGKIVETQDRHSRPVTSLAYSGDGAMLVSGSQDGTIQGWDPGAMQLLSTVSPLSEVRAVALKSDEALLAVGGMDRSIRLLSSAWSQVIMLEGGSGWVNSLAFSPDGNWLASAISDNCQVELWNLPAIKAALATNSAQNEITTVHLMGHTSEAISVAFSPDSQKLVSGSQDGTVRVWEVASGKTLAVLGGPTGDVNGLAFSPDGKTLASGYYNHEGLDADVIQLWDTADYKLDSTLALQDQAKIIRIAYRPDGAVLAVAANRAEVELWTPQAQQKTGELNPYTGQEAMQGVPQSLAYSGDGKLLAVGYGDNIVRVWDTAAGQVTQTLTGHTGTPDAVAFSPDGKTLASASFFGGELRLWDAVTGASLAAIPADSVHALAFSPDGTVLIGAGYQGQRWTLASGQPELDPNFLLESDSSMNSVVYTPDGSLLVTGDNQGLVRLWNAQTGHSVVTLQDGRFCVLSLAVSPDGTQIAAGGDDGLVHVWRIEGLSAALVPTMPPPPAAIPSSPQTLLYAKGCTDCHSFESDETMAPVPLAGIGTRAATRVPGMSAQDYLWQKIAYPSEHPVPGYPAGIMPSSGPDGTIPMDPAELDQIVAYLLTLK